jgi:hypothetical protein
VRWTWCAIAAAPSLRNNLAYRSSRCSTGACRTGARRRRESDAIYGNAVPGDCVVPYSWIRDILKPPGERVLTVHRWPLSVPCRRHAGVPGRERPDSFRFVLPFYVARSSVPSSLCRPSLGDGVAIAAFMAVDVQFGRPPMLMRRARARGRPRPQGSQLRWLRDRLRPRVTPAPLRRRGR